jgi:hypothetical protein
MRASSTWSTAPSRDAFEILVVPVAKLNAGERAGLGHGGLHRGQIELVHGLKTAADGFGAERHRAVDPGADPVRDVATESGRNLDGGLDGATL